MPVMACRMPGCSNKDRIRGPFWTLSCTADRDAEDSVRLGPYQRSQCQPLLPPSNSAARHRMQAYGKGAKDQSWIRHSMQLDQAHLIPEDLLGQILMYRAAVRPPDPHFVLNA